jgi:G3E family GTPase
MFLFTTGKLVRGANSRALAEKSVKRDQSWSVSVAQKRQLSTALPPNCGRLRASAAASPRPSSSSASDPAAEGVTSADSVETVDQRVPVSILTGFLGSGKSTLLNRILRTNHGKRYAVIENEFGEVGIDDELVKSHIQLEGGDELFEMNNGCLCCTVRSDLVRILRRLLTRSARYDGILIETTGMADPTPVIQTFFLDETLADFLRLDGVITVVDAKHLSMHLDPKHGVRRETMEQIAFADRLLLNKIDLVSESELQQAKDTLRRLNTAAPIIPCVRAQVPIDELLNMHAFDLDRITERDPFFLATDRHSADEDHHGHEHHKHDHVHDHSITSVGICEPGDLDVDRLNEWLSDLLSQRGEDIFRMKGILNISGTDRRYIFQGVHMLFESMPSEPWGADPRLNRLVFIGRNLDREAIQKAFRACVKTPV